MVFTYEPTQSNQTHHAIHKQNGFIIATTIDGKIARADGSLDWLESLPNQNMLDKMILTVIPTTIGNGIPLFPNGFKEVKWNLTQVESFETGVVNITYER